MTADELAKLTEIRDGLKKAFWDFDGWRWAAKFDQFIADAAHALEQEGSGLSSPEERSDDTPIPSSERRRGLEEAVDAVDKELEDGSPVYTWSDSDHAVNDARVRAIEAIRALIPPSSEGGEEK